MPRINTGETSRADNYVLPVTPLRLDFEDEGPLPTPEEHKRMLMKWRAKQTARKQKEKGAEKEAERLAKQKEADRLRLQALWLQREEIELQEKALRETLEGGDDRPPESQRKTDVNKRAYINC